MINKIKVIFSTFLRLIFTFIKVGKISLNNYNADYIIWAPNFFNLKGFISGDNFQKVLFTYYHLKKKNKFTTIYTRNDIGRFTEKNIIFFASNAYNIFGFDNYVKSFIDICLSLESQNNQVFPNSHEVKFWENKTFMHEFFDANLIRTPKTKIYEVSNFNSNSIDMKYPLLVKEEHSCSGEGVYKISSKKEMDELISGYKSEPTKSKIILQNLLNMRKDLRVILVGSEIVLHYWRINLSEEWKPTSTSYGSKVDFYNFPEQWRNWIIQNFIKLKIRTGAFDIAWENDDLNTEPYILEVSTFYQPNPKPKNEYDLKNYGMWKKSARFCNSYQISVVNVINDIQKKLINEMLK